MTTIQNRENQYTVRQWGNASNHRKFIQYSNNTKTIFETYTRIFRKLLAT